MNPQPVSGSAPSGIKNAARVIIVGSVMFSFISYWRTAAVVLCDLGSTAYYIGGIVESAIGPAAPWYILAVMLFSYVVRSVYIESCSLFIRGGVYRVVKEALGRFAAKIAVSALIFDYLLTAPISGVSAGQYLMGLFLDTAALINPDWIIADLATRSAIKNWGAVALCLGVIYYFFRLNVHGIHESSDRALKIMIATTVMVVIIIGWCGVTLAVNGIGKSKIENPDGTIEYKSNSMPLLPELSPKEKINPLTKETETHDPIGFLGGTSFGERLRPQTINWLSLFGLAGLLIAFGHSILAMSGEETLAQVYREVESPKLLNFRKAALVVFVYSLVFTAGISFLAVLIIPEDVRMSTYSENLISGLAMSMVGPEWLKTCLNIFVVVIGFMILSGAVNTAIIGSNGVLNRVAEDGILPQWFLKPHPKYGTTHRLLYIIFGLQTAITIFSQGDVILLGEAYAFGVVWSFVFQAVSMVVLRFKDKRPREYKVPLNVTIAGVEYPLGLISVLLLLLCAAIFNLCTKELATIAGAAFTFTFFMVFLITEFVQERRHKEIGGHKHIEQFNQESPAEVTTETLGLTKPFRRMIAIRSTQNLAMLERALADTDPKVTDVVVMTAKTIADNAYGGPDGELDPYDQELMTAVVQKAEQVGKHVKPLIIPTNKPLFAILKTAADLKIHELVVGGSNIYTADEQMEQMSFYWITLHHGQMAPLTVKILTRDREVQFDLGGGNRIPKPGEVQARSVAELRDAGVGIGRVLIVLNDSPEGLDSFQSLLTMIDPQVPMSVAIVGDRGFADKMKNQAEQVERKVAFFALEEPKADALARRATADQADLLVIPLGEVHPQDAQLPLPEWVADVVRKSPCPVALTTTPFVPDEVIDRGTESAGAK
jgi:amino acid transporter/nucleotide-binding universal stress UspA family protein